MIKISPCLSKLLQLAKVLLRHTVIFCLYTDVATIKHTHLFNKIVHMNAVQYSHDISMHTRFVDSCCSLSPVAATTCEDHRNPNEDIHSVEVDANRAAVTRHYTIFIFFSNIKTILLSVI